MLANLSKSSKTDILRKKESSLDIIIPAVPSSPSQAAVITTAIPNKKPQKGAASQLAQYVDMKGGRLSQTSTINETVKFTEVEIDLTHEYSMLPIARIESDWYDRAIS